MKIKLFTLSISLLSALTALGWGQKGHDVTAYIAEQHLTEATRHAVDSILEGRSLVYWSNWLDNASHTPEYAYTKTWHYKNIDADQTYESAPLNPSGDAVTAIRGQIEVLTDPSSTFESSQLALKILDHVMGDLHMPLHMGHASDSGANKVSVKYFNRDYNLHSVWDSQLPESAHKWSYTEWQQQIDRANDAAEAAIIDGNIDDWAKETVTIAGDVYRYFPAGAKISYDGVARWTPVIEQQFLRGGLRLAHVLNTIYDPTYRATTASSPTNF